MFLPLFRFVKTFRFALFPAACSLLLASCGAVRSGWEEGWSERAAQDRIMLVRTTPETLGHRRLVHQSTYHPDLGVFLKSRGLPDFIAETSSEDRQYLILYYLNNGRAFAGRARRIPGTSMEFAGPYRMTEREQKLLRGLQEQAGVGVARENVAMATTRENS